MFSHVLQYDDQSNLSESYSRLQGFETHKKVAIIFCIHESRLLVHVLKRPPPRG